MYNSNLACKLADISKTQLNYWVSSGIIVTAMPTPPQKGQVWRFSFTDLVQLKTASWLRKQGLPLQRIRNALQYLQEHQQEIVYPLAELRFLTDGKEVFILSKDPQLLSQNHLQLINASQYGQAVWCIKIGEIASEVQQAIHQQATPQERTITLNKKHYALLLTPELEEGGYVVECPALPGCLAQGETQKEALASIRSAIVEWLAVAAERDQKQRHA